MSVALPSVEDWTPQLIDRVKASFIGIQVDQPLDTFEDNTSTTLGFTTGTKIKARGSAKIEELVAQTGNIKKVVIPSIATMWVSDNLTFTFRCSSWTRAETWVYPGGAFVDHPWFNSTPGGTVKFIVIFNQGNASLNMDIIVETGHDDRPNRFIKEWVLPKFRAAFDNLLEAFTGTPVN